MSNSSDPREIKRELRWRADILSSSALLEYTTGKALAASGFFVYPGYPYVRLPDSRNTEYSVDIRATKRLKENSRAVAAIQLLVECKYRAPDIDWIFFRHPDEPIMMLEQVLRCFESFSVYAFKYLTTIDFAPVELDCFKGLEVNRAKSFAGTDKRRAANDEELLHGIDQLRFAVPWLIRAHMIENLWRYRDPGQRKDCAPLFFLPVLLTNAPLFIVHSDVRSDQILTAGSVADFADPVDWLVRSVGSGPLFSQHVSGVFETLVSHDVDTLKSFDKLREGRGHKPSEMLSSLVERGAESNEDYFGSYLLVRERALPALLERVEEHVLYALGERTWSDSE